MSSHSEVYRPDIDGVRAIAVLAAISFHAFPLRVTGGFVGVDVFFVISGFLITSIILRGFDSGHFSFAEFYSRRVRRIFPALIVVLIFCLVVGWYELWISEYDQLGRHVLAAVGFVSNVVLWREAGYFDTASETKPLLHLWSLGIEEQYYLVWPLMIWIVVKLRRSIAPLVGITLILSFGLSIWLVNRDATAAFYLPFPRFWELMVGSAFAYAVARNRIPFITRFSVPLSFIGLFSIFAAILLLTRDSKFPGWWALLPTIGTLFIIAAGPDTWINRRVLSHRVLVFVGLISYPLYLWHWPILTFLHLISVQEPSKAMRLAALIASMILAWLTYALIERRVRAASARRLAPALCVLLAAIGLVGFGIKSSSGFPTRFPAEIREINRYALFSDEITREWRRHRCMLEKEVEFAQECIDAEPAGKPSVVLWGDSHSASLYPGIRDMQAHSTFRIAQFSMGRCPPILGFLGTNPKLDGPECAKNNNFALAKIRELKPKVVLMVAWWGIYDTRLLKATLDSMRALEIEHIVIVGDVPVWRQIPRRVIFHIYNRDEMHVLPARVARDNFFPMPTRADSVVSSIAQAAGVDYVAMVPILCDSASCLATIANTTAYTDGNHLSPPAAKFVARSAFTQFIEAPASPGPVRLSPAK